MPDNYLTRVELQWPIYTGGRLEALHARRGPRPLPPGKDLDAARADLKLEVTRAFWALVTARESARVLGEAVKRVDAQLADVRSRLEAGFVPPNDVLTVEAQRARQQVLLIEAREQAGVVAEADLGRLVGAPDRRSTSSSMPRSTSRRSLRRIGDTAALLADATLEPARARRARQPHRRAERTAACRVRPGGCPTVSFLTGTDYARPNPKIFPREDSWKNTVGRRRRRSTGRLGLRPHEGGSGGGGEPGARGPRAARRFRYATSHSTLRQRLLELASARAETRRGR